ncbi:Fe-S protein assembly chaperone HscA [Candidatus Bodocaedibacter vickermanii]|uniref:Chaperone protein HscA n=1 Tax=Candidatus Bodocaedibacter vickermanii TaxID=2741701 RepID=A0A7L9RTS2_9PROT|nr:Chaperone protein HscA [Candidatus Paracaedibacteraceae bacterium 'Lake Konstanz']
MLIQITDPSVSKVDTDTMYAIGIDFGTTHCVAGLIRDNKVELIPLNGESFLLPSIVNYRTDQILVGDTATTETGPIHSIKRIIGRSLAEVHSILDHHPFNVTQTELGIKLKTAMGLQDPAQVASALFRYIKHQAELYLDQDVTEAVVTVPAYFDEVARAGIKDAARLAGLTVLRLVAEPTAAALAYGIDDAKEGVYIVYDLGGGTFDVSVLRMTQGVFQVLATGGNAFLGGDDIDATIVDYFLSESQLTPEQRRNALSHARHVKERLSTQLKATFDTPLGDRCVLKRETFEDLLQPLICETIKITRETLDQAHVNLSETQGIILVGGSTRIPAIETTLSDFFNVPIFQSLNPDEVVAMGAARQAHLLTQGGDSMLIDVAPLSLGVEMMGGVVDKIIPRNSPIPIRKAQNFTTFQDNQTGIVINVVQGERELAKDCRSLGRFILSGIPPMPAGLAKVSVIFALDADGLLSVTATEETTGIVQTVVVKPTYGLSEDAMKEMILDSHRHAQADMQKRLLTQTTTEAKQLINVVEQALFVDSDLLSTIEQANIQTAIDALSKALLDEDRDLIKEHMERLNHLTTEFAHKRLQKYL